MRSVIPVHCKLRPRPIRPAPFKKKKQKIPKYGAHFATFLEIQYFWNLIFLCIIFILFITIMVTLTHITSYNYVTLNISHNIYIYLTNLLFLLSTASENPGYLQNSPKFPRDPQRFTETSMKGSFLKILNPIHSFWKRLGLKKQHLNTKANT